MLTPCPTWSGPAHTFPLTEPPIPPPPPSTLFTGSPLTAQCSVSTPHETSWSSASGLPRPMFLWPCAQEPLGVRVSPAGGDDTVGHTAMSGTLSPGLGPSASTTMESTGGLEGAESFRRLCSPHFVLTGPHVQWSRGHALSRVLRCPKPTEGSHPDSVPPSRKQGTVGREVRWSRAVSGFVARLHVALPEQGS